MTLEFYETHLSMDWDTARFYCFALNIDGKIGWRLPTKEEFSQYNSKVSSIQWYWSAEESGHQFAKSLYPYPDLIEDDTDLKTIKWSVIAVRNV